MGRFAYLVPAILLGGSLLFASEAQLCPDLDGDHKPDMLRVSSARRDSLGYFYTLDFEMSSGAARRSILVRSKSPNGVRVVPRDVDGDHDVDLVITNVFDLQPIGVLFNDGGGVFTVADATPWNWTQPRQSALDVPLSTNRLGAEPFTSSTQVIAPVERGDCSWACPPSASRAVPSVAPGDSGVLRFRSSRAPPVR